VKTAASDVAVSLLGLINFQVDVLPVAQSEASGPKFKTICSTCSDPTPVNQQYVCPKNHGPFKAADLPKALEVGKTLKPVSAEEIEKLRKPKTPPKELTLGVFPTEQVNTRTRPTGAVYRLRAERNQALVQMVTDMVSGGEITFVGELVLPPAGERLFRLGVWKGALMLEELARPELVHDFESAPVTYEPKLLEQAKQLAQLQNVEFDPAQYRNSIRDRIADLAATGEGVPVALATPTQSDLADNLLAALEAAVNAKAA
jgi:non-homologous end joining protein Ku